VADNGDGQLKRLNPDGSINLAVPLGANPHYPVFDGANIWTPTSNDSVVVVRAVTGAIVGTLTSIGCSNNRGLAESDPAQQLSKTRIAAQFVEERIDLEMD
jgi:hypothetical protein